MSQAEENEIQEHAGKIENHLFMAMGRALSSWSAMELVLIGIVAVLLETPHKKTGVLMYSIISFGTWMQIITELVTIDPKYATKKRMWTRMEPELRRLKDIRDRIAHQEVTSDLGQFVIASLKPAYLDLRQKSLKQRPLTPMDVYKYNDDVLECSQRLLLFMLELQKILAAIKPAIAVTKAESSSTSVHLP